MCTLYTGKHCKHGKNSVLNRAISLKESTNVPTDFQQLQVNATIHVHLKSHISYLDVQPYDYFIKLSSDYHVVQEAGSNND